MTNTFTFKWNTGKIEIAACAVLKMNATQLKSMVKTATENAEEVKEQIREYIHGEIQKLNPKNEYDKKTIEQYNKLIAAACGERRQSRAEKAIARIIKNTNREQFAGVFEDCGKYCVLDGYRIIRYAAPLNGFPAAKESFDTAKAIGTVSNYTVKLALPAVKDLKADMKLAKIGCIDVGHVHVSGRGRSIKLLYDFGYGLPVVDAAYLADMLEALPECEAYATETMQICGRNIPIYFVAGDNDGLLCPVRKHQEWEPAPIVEKADEWENIDPAEVRETLEASRESGSAFVERVMADAEAIAEDEQIEDKRRAETIERVQAVYNAIYYGYTGERDKDAEARLAGFKYSSGFFTEERIKQLLLFPVSVSNEVLLALPAHVEPVQEAENVWIVHVLDYACLTSTHWSPRRSTQLPHIRAEEDSTSQFSTDVAFCKIAAIDSS